jgi:hypothetical protein
VPGLLEAGSGEGRTMTVDENLKNLESPDDFEGCLRVGHPGFEVEV